MVKKAIQHVRGHGTDADIVSDTPEKREDNGANERQDNLRKSIVNKKMVMNIEETIYIYQKDLERFNAALDQFLETWEV